MAGSKTYILRLKNGSQRRITIPEEWKITFGPLTPGVREVASNMALRIYESKEKQRAVFLDVVEFRDQSIPIEERVKKKKTQTVSKQTPEGVKEYVVSAEVAEWRDPDDNYTPGEEFTALPDFSDIDFTEGQQ